MISHFTVALVLVCLSLLAAPGSAGAQGPSATVAPEPPQQSHHALPFLLDEVPEEYRGQVPLPVGISFVYVHQTLPLVINNPSFVVGGSPLPPGLVQGGSLKAVTDTLVARADVWLLPFLNVYGTAAHLSGDARDISVSLAAPVPIPIPDQVSYSGSDYGFGFTAAFGYRAFFASYDVNWNWAKPDVINRVRVQVQSPRIGVLFVPWGVHGKVYAGAMRLAIAGTQTGSVDLQPGVSLEFSLEARPENAWSPLVGAEFEIARHLMLVAEGNFGKTSQVLLSTGYRF